LHMVRYLDDRILRAHFHLSHLSHIRLRTPLTTRTSHSFYTFSHDVDDTPTDADDTVICCSWRWSK
jgi:hypothetical protein